MSQILRGNFTTKKDVTPQVQAPTLEQQFEREALKRLGGSIAFVSKKKLLWTGDDDGRRRRPSDPPAAPADKKGDESVDESVDEKVDEKNG